SARVAARSRSRPRKSACVQRPTWTWASMITASIEPPSGTRSKHRGAQTPPRWPGARPRPRPRGSAGAEARGQVAGDLGVAGGGDVDDEALLEVELLVDEGDPAAAGLDGVVDERGDVADVLAVDEDPAGGLGADAEQAVAGRRVGGGAPPALRGQL